MSDTTDIRYALEAARVAVNGGDEPGMILRVDGRVTAVLVRLDAEYNGDLRGCWYLEAGFGRCAGQPPAPFRQLAGLLAWIADRLGDDLDDLGEVSASLTEGKP